MYSRITELIKVVHLEVVILAKTSNYPDVIDLQLLSI